MTLCGSLPERRLCGMIRLSWIAVSNHLLRRGIKLQSALARARNAPDTSMDGGRHNSHKRMKFMARSLRQERQALSVDEFKLVEQTHHPALGLLSDKDLAELVKLVRERRERARTIAARQRRELRGKSEPKGARAATDDTGTRIKRDVLAAALQRLNKEASRRNAKAARQTLTDNARRALELRQENQAKTIALPSGLTPNTGMQLKSAGPGRRPRNPAKVGAISQHTKNMQAKRDSK